MFQIKNKSLEKNWSLPIFTKAKVKKENHIVTAYYAQHCYTEHTVSTLNKNKRKKKILKLST